LGSHHDRRRAHLGRAVNGHDYGSDFRRLEHDKRWRAEWQRQEAAAATLRQIEALRSQLRALEAELAEETAKPEADDAQ
jgi:hypothetical protein